MKKLEECARAVVPHICRATQDIDFEQDARDFRDAKEIVRAVIRCLMEPSKAMTDRARMVDVETWDDCLQILRDEDSAAILRAMLQSVLDENKE